MFSHNIDYVKGTVFYSLLGYRYTRSQILQVSGFPLLTFAPPICFCGLTVLVVRCSCFLLGCHACTKKPHASEVFLITNIMDYRKYLNRLTLHSTKSPVIFTSLTTTLIRLAHSGISLAEYVLSNPASCLSSSNNLPSAK